MTTNVTSDRSIHSSIAGMNFVILDKQLDWGQGMQNGSAGDRTSRIKSVISVPEGNVTVAPTSALGVNLPWWVCIVKTETLT